MLAHFSTTRSPRCARDDGNRRILHSVIANCFVKQSRSCRLCHRTNVDVHQMSGFSPLTARSAGIRCPSTRPTRLPLIGQSRRSGGATKHQPTPTHSRSVTRHRICHLTNVDVHQMSGFSPLTARSAGIRCPSTRPTRLPLTSVLRDRHAALAMTEKSNLAPKPSLRTVL